MCGQLHRKIRVHRFIGLLSICQTVSQTKSLHMLYTSIVCVRSVRPQAKLRRRAFGRAHSIIIPHTRSTENNLFVWLSGDPPSSSSSSSSTPNCIMLIPKCSSDVIRLIALQSDGRDCVGVRVCVFTGSGYAKCSTFIIHSHIHTPSMMFDCCVPCV